MTSRERVIESLSKAKILDLAALRGVVQELRDMSPDEVVACFLRLPANKRAVVIIDDKSPDGKGGGPHVGRRSCVICRGGLTERNQLAASSAPERLGVTPMARSASGSRLMPAEPARPPPVAN